jgi:hypothetical protein
MHQQPREEKQCEMSKTTTQNSTSVAEKRTGAGREDMFVVVR